MIHWRRYSPWLVSLFALFFYALTLAHGLTINNLPLVVKIIGDDPTPWLGHPLLWALTTPLRLLPMNIAATGLNLFSAACAAATLGFLFRSVQLLPQNRMPIQRLFLADENGVFQRSDNWIPALLAVIICGLEFNFWQQATTSAGDTLDVLLLALATWLLLEQRLNYSPRGMAFTAFVWGLGMAESWVMFVLLPVFIVAILWQRGMSFFDKKFLLRLVSCGFAGFFIYALLPLVNSLSPQAQWSFGEAWLTSLKQTKQAIGTLFSWFFINRKDMGALVIFYFMMPILPCLIRVPDEGGYHGTLVSRLQILLYHLTHLLLLFGCLWLALDPQIGPRQIILKQFGLAMPLLTFDYTIALGAGYFAGYFLVIYGSNFRSLSRDFRFQRPPFMPAWSRKITRPLLIVILLALTALLLLRSYSAIKQFNRQPLKSFGELAVSSLPPGDGIILADDPIRLTAFEAALNKQQKSQWQTVDSSLLPAANYRSALQSRSALGWIDDTSRHELQPYETLHLLTRLARTNQIFYLHPSFGYFMDTFYLQPHGALYELKKYPPDQRLTSPPSPLETNQIANAEKFWDEVFQSRIQPIAQIFAPKSATLTERLLKNLKSSPPRDNQTRLLGEWYSIALNDWGVRLQRQALLGAAQKRFEQAASATTNNLVATFNLNCNANLRAGNPMDLSGVPTLAGQFRNLKQINQLLVRFGPIDDPVFSFMLGTIYTQSGLPRQAIQEFQRARILAPGAAASGLALAQIYSQLRMDSDVFKTVRELRQSTKNSSLAAAVEIDLAALETRAWLSQTNPRVAREVLDDALEKHPGDERLLELLMQTYLASGDYTNALQSVNHQVATRPDHLPALMNQSVILLMLNQPSNALPILDHILTLTNSPKMRINRAAANLKVGNIQAAEADYQLLSNFTEGVFQMNFGLAQIANVRRQTNLAITHLQICLSNSVTDSPKWLQARKLLDQLQAAHSTR